jgi:hypothetical protein
MRLYIQTSHALYTERRKTKRLVKGGVVIAEWGWGGGGFGPIRRQQNYNTTVYNTIQYNTTVHIIEEKRGQSNQASSSIQLLQKVISGIFPSSTHRVYRLHGDWSQFLAYIHSVLYPVPLSPFALVTAPPFSVSKYSLYRQCVAGRGWEVLSRVGDHILQDILHSVSESIRILQNCSITPRQKTSRGGSLRQINTCREVPFPRHFF